MSEKPGFVFPFSSIRLGEFDLGGVLYHSNYFHLYEQAREAFLTTVGIPYPQLVQQQQHLAVVESHQSFLSPIRYGDSGNVHLTARDIQRSSFVVCYGISLKVANTENLVHEAWTRHAFVELGGNGLRPARIPEQLRTALVRIEPGKAL